MMSQYKCLVGSSIADLPHNRRIVRNEWSSWKDKAQLNNSQNDCDNINPCRLTHLIKNENRSNSIKNIACKMKFTTITKLRFRNARKWWRWKWYIEQTSFWNKNEFIDFDFIELFYVWWSECNCLFIFSDITHEVNTKYTNSSYK